MESIVRELSLSEIVEEPIDQDGQVEETIDQDGQEGTEIQYSSWDMVEHTWDEHHSKIMRACLQFCYLFPQDYEFQKNDLILLWIAEELLSGPQNETPAYSELVDRGSLYFGEFEEMNIFLASSLDHSTHLQRYKLNKSVFHLLQQQHDDAYFRVHDTNSYAPDSTLHSSIYDSSIDAITLEKLYHAKRLCTLLILHENGSKLDQVPREVFLKLPLIGVLDLSGTNIKEVPSSIGKLKQLRYLNLSRTPIARLPESVCSLYQMRILKLKGCLKLVSLPNGMRRLVRLQYLDVDIARLLVSMPPGFGDLTDLNHLPAFVVGKENGCCITELKEMVNLHGTLRILRLENVSSSKEAADATLDGKKHIVKLELQWTEFNDGIQFEVLQNLQPHTQIEELQIVGFAGLEFPSWIGDPQFSKLVKVTLHDCKKCERLPPLGKLPFLKHLFISDMLAVQVIDTLFYGGDMVGGLASKATTQFKYRNIFFAFPSLENLTLNGMPALEKWIRIEKGDFHHLQKLSITCCQKLTSLPEVSFLVSLQQLEISLCTSLKSLPNEGLPISLQWLIIMECPLLKEWCLKEAKLERGKLADIPNVWIDHLQISLAAGTLREPIEYPEREGQPVCQYYLKTGTCKFGASCKFHHPKYGSGSFSNVSLNNHGYPLRPGEKECSYYVKTGQCKFGITCKFHHPQPAGTSGSAPAPAFYPTVQSSLIPSTQQYGVSSIWQFARPPAISGSYVQGAYSHMLLPPGMVPFPGRSPYAAPAYAGPYPSLPSSANVSSNIQNESIFPERPGQPECLYYMRTGHCCYGSSCRFHHPSEWMTSNISSGYSHMGLPLRPNAEDDMQNTQVSDSGRNLTARQKVYETRTRENQMEEQLANRGKNKKQLNMKEMIFGKKSEEGNGNDGKDLSYGSSVEFSSNSISVSRTPLSESEVLRSSNLKSFSFAELKIATRNFGHIGFLGEARLCSVFKGWINEKTLTANKPGTGMVVAVKILNKEGIEGRWEWLAPVVFMGQFYHPNLVRLVGYCLEDEQRLLVYEYLPRGSLETNLFRRNYPQLAWSLRMKVALGAAKGLAFLHNTEHAVYRDFGSSKIFLDSDYNAKLSDFILDMDLPTANTSHVSTRLVGAFGYSAPEYITTGHDHLSVKSDVYSFGVVLLQLLSGLPVNDNLVEWARPYLSNERKFYRILDSRLRYPEKGAFQAASIAVKCLSAEPSSRPSMDEVVKALEVLQTNNTLPTESGPSKVLQ